MKTINKLPAENYSKVEVNSSLKSNSNDPFIQKKLQMASKILKTLKMPIS